MIHKKDVESCIELLKCCLLSKKIIIGNTKMKSKKIGTKLF